MSATPFTKTKPKPLSASSVKSLMSCSLAYYYSRVLGLPEKEWPKTKNGIS